MTIPEGLTRCDVCGELNGTFLHADGSDPEPSPTAVQCACDRTTCALCGQRAARWPTTNYYDERRGTVAHAAVVGGRPTCVVCYLESRGIEHRADRIGQTTLIVRGAPKTTIDQMAPRPSRPPEPPDSEVTLEEWKASQAERWQLNPDFLADLETKAAGHGWEWVREHYGAIRGYRRLAADAARFQAYFDAGGTLEDW